MRREGRGAAFRGHRRTHRECFLTCRSLHPPGPATAPVSARAEVPTLIFDLNPGYVRDAARLLQRHLESNGTLEYQVEVLTRQHAPVLIYQSDSGAHVAANADASVGLFDSPYDQIFRR